MSNQLHIHVAGEPDSDDIRRAALTDRLMSELHAHDFEATRPTTAAPVNTKGSALEWAQLVVTLSGTLPLVVGAVRAWLDRHEGVKITVSIDDDEITIDNPTDAEQAELLRAWVDRHGAD